jgi:hypothetical protein
MIMYRAHVGAKATMLTDVCDLTAAVLNLEHLHVSSQPRAVVRGQGLPTSKELEAFFAAVEVGADLNAAQSNYYSAVFNDRMLNDLGVHHFCFTHGPRADLRLFAIVTKDVFYAIEVAGHSTFERETLIQRVHDQWPQLLVPFIPPGVVPGSLKGPSLEERGAMRVLGFNTGLQMRDGTISLPPGGGMVFGGLTKSGDPEKSRGLSWVVACRADSACNHIRRLEDHVLHNVEKLDLDYPGQQIALAYCDGELYAANFEKSTATRLGSSPLRLRLDPEHWLFPHQRTLAS